MKCEGTKASIPDVILITPEVFRDSRGTFLEFYNASAFQGIGINVQFAQSNHSRSHKGVLRGLHYQLNPSAQGKLVYVVNGEIFDVAVDLRRGSPAYGKWTAYTLSSENKRMLYIPPGFAHGFCVLSDDADVIYHCTREYAPKDERGIIWNDPQLRIDWPIENPLLSEKDANLPTLAAAVLNFKY